MSELFLGIIAISVLVMALIQVGALVAAFRVAKRVEHVSRQLETDIRPLIANLAEVTAELSRTASVATRQVERTPASGAVLGRPRRPARTSQVNALDSWIETFGSAASAIRSFAESPTATPAKP